MTANETVWLWNFGQAKHVMRKEINTHRHLTYKQTIPKKTKGPAAFRRLSRRGRDTNETWLPASLAPWNQHIRKLGDDSLRLRRVFVLLNSPEVSSSCWHLHGVWAPPPPSRATGLQHTSTTTARIFSDSEFCPDLTFCCVMLMIMITLIITLRKKIGSTDKHLALEAVTKWCATLFNTLYADFFLVSFVFWAFLVK